MTISCKYHPYRKATHIFKVHAPKHSGGPEEFNRNLEYAHNMNIFLCDYCTEGLKIDKERYVRFRTSPRVAERLVDNWEKEWQLIYGTEDEWIFVAPRATVYAVNAPELDENAGYTV